MTCRDCRWFDLQEGHWGKCHRFPPINTGKAVKFADVQTGDWCGEWEREVPVHLRTREEP